VVKSDWRGLPLAIHYAGQWLNDSPGQPPFPQGSLRFQSVHRPGSAFTSPHPGRADSPAKSPPYFILMELPGQRPHDGFGSIAVLAHLSLAMQAFNNSMASERSMRHLILLARN
jgi:hypothetical protein